LEKSLICNSLDELTEVAKSVITFAGTNKLWLFYGEMGSGKTTLIKEICDLLKVEENVSSPTYSIVNEYQNDEGEIFYHFDFYRIKNEGEAFDIGYEDYFFSGNYCFVEWPEKIPNLIPEGSFKIAISILENNSRLIQMSKR
jgi:tRNA threonylcarbamoyladenosine biosynthesis protein TsaE